MIDINAMTIEQKIGQLMLCGFPSKAPDAHLKALICDRKVGNIIFFARNVGTIGEIVALTGGIQEMAMENCGAYAFIVADQECGRVARISHPAMTFPSALSFGEAGVKGAAYKQGAIIGRGFKALGIGVNSTCVDVNTNPRNPIIGNRAFGSDPALVAELACEYLRGFQEQGVITGLKHFPGHGSTSEDTHLGMAKVTHNLDDWKRIDLAPYKAAIGAGLKVVMTAHVITPLDGRPASLSHAVLTGVLRNELGFDGIIESDCLEMNAISQTIGVGNAAVEAILAGTDILCVSHSLEKQIEAMDALMRAVDDGTLPMSRVDESVERILAAKASLALPLSVSDAEAVIGPPVFSELALEVSRRSIKVIKDGGGLRVDKGAMPIVVSPMKQQAGVEDDPSASLMGRIFKESIGCECIDVRLPAQSEYKDGGFLLHESTLDEGQIGEIIRECRDMPRVMLGVCDSLVQRGERDLARRLCAEHDNVTVVLFEPVNDVLDLSGAKHVIAAHEYTVQSVRSVADMLTGA